MIHEAGPYDADGVQRCARCRIMLTDHRGAMVPTGTPPLRGWEEGAAVEVEGTNPRYLGLSTDPPDCVVTQ